MKFMGTWLSYEDGQFGTWQLAKMSGDSGGNGDGSIEGVLEVSRLHTWEDNGVFSRSWKRRNKFQGEK